MTSVRTISILATTTLSLLAAPAFAAGNDEHDAHHPAAAAEQRLAQAPQAAQGMGMGMGGALRALASCRTFRVVNRLLATITALTVATLSRKLAA